MKLILIFLFAGILAVGSPLQGTASVTLVNAGDGVNDGSYYVSPYTLDINGKNYAVMCVDFLDDSYIGASWTANFTDLSPSTTDFSKTYVGQGENSSNAATIYQEEAYLYSMIVNTNDPTQRINIQHAAWSLTDPDYALDAGSEAELQIAEQNYDSPAFQSQLSNYEVVSDISQSGRQQEFLMSSAPEPGPVALLGAGLIFITGALRRIRRKNNA
jgi:hypothetical protein